MTKRNSSKNSLLVNSPTLRLHILLRFISHIQCQFITPRILGVRGDTWAANTKAFSLGTSLVDDVLLLEVILKCFTISIETNMLGLITNASLSHRTGAYIKKLRKIAPADCVELYGFSSRIYMTLFIMAYLFAFAMVYVWEMLTEKLCHKFSYAASSQSFISIHCPPFWLLIWRVAFLQQNSIW